VSHSLVVLLFSQANPEQKERPAYAVLGVRANGLYNFLGVRP